MPKVFNVLENLGVTERRLQWTEEGEGSWVSSGGRHEYSALYLGPPTDPFDWFPWLLIRKSSQKGQGQRDGALARITNFGHVQEIAELDDRGIYNIDTREFSRGIG